MKKSAFPAAILLLGVALSGCPVYDSSDSGCFDDYDCAEGYLCDGRTGECVSNLNTAPGACQSPTDCGLNETCSRSGTCVTGDCSFASVGCVRGYECSSASGRWECVKPSAVGAGGSDAGGASTAAAGQANAGSAGATDSASAGAGG